MKQKKLLIAVDGNSLMHRAYYALPAMSSSDGTPTGAIFGFLSMLLKLIERDPDYLVVAFDLHGPTFRHMQFEEYKAGRRETPDDLRPQFLLLQEIIKKMGILVSTCEGFEADDILGTFAKRAENKGIFSILVTGDKDALQLISPDTHVLLTKKGISETAEMDEPALMEEYGLTPLKMRDLKGLMGDNSDNIPGIPGVGEKTALKLLADYGSMEEVLSNSENIKGKLGEKIKQHAELARMSYRLGVIEQDAPVEDSLTDCVFSKTALKNAIPVLRQYQLNAIIKRLPQDKSGNDLPVPTNDAEKYRTVSIQSLTEMQQAANKTNNAPQLSLCAVDDMLYFAASGQREQYQVCFSGTLLQPGLEPQDVFAILKPQLENDAQKKLLFDAKKWMHLLDAYGITLKGLEFDAMIVDYLLNAIHPATSLEALTQARLGEGPSAAALVRLYPLMMQELEEKELLALYQTMERPLISVLYRMEKQGFLVDTAVLLELKESFTARIDSLAEEIYALAGERFNILSTKQLGGILFEKLGLPTGRKTKTGYSTDADVLDALSCEHPIIGKIQEYRFLPKLNSTFVEGLLLSIAEKDGRVHTSFNQNVTATGRISSTDPNLQNIPVRTEQGREIRKAFVASPGNVLLGADYSQIELRLLAHISGDEAMTAAFLSDGDIHTRTAGEVFGVEYSEVTMEQRGAAKAVNFGIVYGISDFGLSRNLGIGKRQAGEYIEKYLDRYKGVRAYMKQSVEKGKAEGYVKTILGRRRDLPEINSGQYNTRSFGERVAMNMPIQGSAADIIKLAMVHVDAALNKGGYGAKLILQVHDELLFDVPIDEASQVAGVIADSMQNAMRLSVPLVADVRAGHSWNDTK